MAQAQNRFVVLATLRHLLRATRIAFQGDAEIKRAARKLALEQFRAKRHVTAGGTEAAQAVEHAQGVARILRENVVQGMRTGENTYKLNIHEQTQRLDNASAGTLKGTTKSFKDIKAAVF